MYGQGLAIFVAFQNSPPVSYSALTTGCKVPDNAHVLPGTGFSVMDQVKVSHEFTRPQVPARAQGS